MQNIYECTKCEHKCRVAVFEKEKSSVNMVCLFKSMEPDFIFEKTCNPNPYEGMSMGTGGAHF